MSASSRPGLYVGLIHYPVVNKHGAEIASAVTNLDLHDISRAARTYGARGFYVVTPLEDQKTLVRRIVDHWVTGVGADYNPKRREALELIRVAHSLEDAADDIEQAEGRRPRTVATCARRFDRSVGFGRLRDAMNGPDPTLLLFGTAWGLSEAVIAGTDEVLAPVEGTDGYNHLSVRSAAGIILDRLMRQDH